MKKALQLTTLSLSLMVSPLFAAKNETRDVRVTDKQVRHYVTQIIADVFGRLGAVTVGGTAAFTGVATSAAIALVLEEISKKPHPSPLEFAFIVTPAATLTLMGIAAAWTILYKTPQWTDTYLLEYKNKRTTKQNIITFLNRALLGPIIGTCTGEYLAGTAPESDDSSDK